MSIDERVRQAWRRRVPDVTDAEIDAIAEFLRSGDDVTRRLVKAYRAGGTIAEQRRAAQLREALQAPADATWNDLLDRAASSRPPDASGTCRESGCDEPFNDCPLHTAAHPEARIYVACARCGHTAPECITCGVDTPILGAAIAGRRYCHDWGAPSCYTLTLREVIT